MSEAKGPIDAIKSQRGFTLIEMAIVLVIIGLLLGAVLKGQQMVENTRVIATAADFNNIRAAANTFHDRYQTRPGDFNNATKQLPTNQYPTIAPVIADGDGNGIIGADMGANLGAAISYPTENTQFWMHLRVAGLLGKPRQTGISSNALNEAAAVYGQLMPSGRFGGGFHVLYGNDNTGRYTHWLRLAAGGDIGTSILGTNATLAATPALTANEAYALDLKMDDGNPFTGSVQAGNTVKAGAGGCVSTTTPVSYLQTDDIGCWIISDLQM
ncbi:MAG: prepilin-type N-terminal cleavage/methylation domain-containing protein [Alphaproteobacteria bacterium]|nr:prepilin-type N-terminal cleavage/methylation domain-containing protein [Alphaproteobacteria bacterium]